MAATTTTVTTRNNSPIRETTAARKGQNAVTANHGTREPTRTSGVHLRLDHVVLLPQVNKENTVPGTYYLGSIHSRTPRKPPVMLAREY